MQNHIVKIVNNVDYNFDINYSRLLTFASMSSLAQASSVKLLSISRNQINANHENHKNNDATNCATDNLKSQVSDGGVVTVVSNGGCCGGE